MKHKSTWLLQFDPCQYREGLPLNSFRLKLHIVVPWQTKNLNSSNKQGLRNVRFLLYHPLCSSSFCYLFIYCLQPIMILLLSNSITQYIQAQCDRYRNEFYLVYDLVKIFLDQHVYFVSKYAKDKYRKEKQHQLIFLRWGFQQ